MKQKHFIDLHKGLTVVVCLVLMAIYHQWDNSTAWVYTALHGTYGILWVLKSRIFPDRSWEREASLGLGLIYWAGLTLYWITPWLINSRDITVPGWYLGICISMNIFGVFFHFVTDMQKFTALQLEPGALITNGMMGRVRNLNYFGELLIYLGFGLLARHWLPPLIVLAYVVVIWLPNMRRKDRSLSRYAEFDAYRQHTDLFIPFLW
jgi:protein-S-isoprenylcysteine O-methyltransferase Ste14